MNTRIPERITALRELMLQNHIDAYIVPTSDPHISEYPAACWLYREWISGFTGSAGTVVVTKNKAGLWTDSRYFLQAEQQLKDTGINLYKQKIPGTPTIERFLQQELEEGNTVGLNGDTFCYADTLSLQSELGRKGIQLDTTHAFIEKLWKDRPALPEAPVFDMPIEFCGQSVEDKLLAINEMLLQSGADCTILSALDEVAWTFNIRGTDVDFNPVAVSFAFISAEENVLFINQKKVPQEIAQRLTKEGVKLADYGMLGTYLSRLKEGTRVLVDYKYTNTAICNAIPKNCVLINALSPANNLKSIKNETELKGFKKAVIRDGVAMTKFFYWLENAVHNGEKITELQASNYLTQLRSEQDLYVMNSFETISSYGSNGAIVHYEPTPESDTELKRDSLYLVDSGGQYLDGTTDITRTIALCDEPTEQMKKDFTRVLKGTIGIAKCKFPAGARGCQVDAFARKALWDAGINYLHGTGHGIGHCLNVHEGPESIRMEENPVTLQPGMVISDEPGMYKTGEYGIRIENIVLVRKDSQTEFGEFYGFDTLTLCYIDTKLIIPSMLSVRERAWLNRYHQQVYEQLSPLLDDNLKQWLKEKTAEI